MFMELILGRYFLDGLTMFVHIQVFECIQALLKSDPDVVVKRSAAVCATLLLRGLSKDCLKVVTASFTFVVTKFLNNNDIYSNVCCYYCDFYCKSSLHNTTTIQ